MPVKGKCYSKVNQGQRKKGDFYQTPYSMTEQILETIYINPKSSILEPAAGDGAIVKVLKKHFSKDQFPNITIYASDINRQVCNWNFLTTDFKQRFDWIITNPPYSLANEFVVRAKEIASNVLMLLPLNYLQGQRRYQEEIFNTLNSIYIFTRMPMLSEEIREDGKYKTGMQAYAWYYWNSASNTEPTIYWLDNQKYVLRKGEY